MLWLDTSWVPNLTYIFRPHFSLFIVIFSTWTSFHHYFPISHITTCDIHSLSFFSSLFTRHYPCFTLSGVFSHVTTWRIVTSFPLVHPMGSGSEILFWEVVLLVRIHVTFVCGEGLIICVCIFMWGHSLLIRVCTKKKWW